MPLTPRQQRFVEEYLVDLNATQAATRAGYSAKTAASIGEENLRKPEIQEAVRMGREAQADRTKIDADWVLRQLVANVERASQAVPVLNAKGEETGEYTYQGSVVNKALELIGQRVGFFPDKKVGLSVAGKIDHEHTGAIDVKLTPAEHLARLAAALDATADDALAEGEVEAGEDPSGAGP